MSRNYVIVWYLKYTSYVELLTHQHGMSLEQTSNELYISVDNS